MKKYAIEIKWGIIFFAISILWLILEKIFGFHDEYIHLHPYITNIFFIPAILMYVMALREKRSKDFNGEMTWMQGFISGIVISLVVAILSAPGQILVHEYLTPDYFANAIKGSVELGYYETEAEAAKNFNLNNYMIQSSVGALIMGVLTGAIVSIFLKTSKKK